MDIAKLSRLALTARILSVEAVEKANSGHPGLPLGAADFTAVLWSQFLRFNPREPMWANRDRFVLSAGHGSMLWYSMLHLFGYDLPMSELRSFRQWDSKTPGHPELGLTPGVETTTGPLGQGAANAVGIALSGKMLAARYSKELFNYRVFALVSDGDLMEGISSEAASLAAHLKLGNLIYLYDDNNICLASDTKAVFTEDVGKRFEAFGWFVQSVDGHDMQVVHQAIERATNETERPSLIRCKTTIGFGSPKAGTTDVHGAPLGKDGVAATKEKLGWHEGEFEVPKDVAEYCASLVEQKAQEYRAWQEKFLSWKSAHPELAAEWEAQKSLAIPAELKEELFAAFKDGKKAATRELSGQAINVIAKRLPHFVGGAADLESSTKTVIKGAADVQAESYGGRNIRFGVREHAMGAIINGMASQGCWLPYTATFLVFSDYMRPPMRLAALSHIRSLFLFTHDSFWVGEDGPTHEPIEHIAALRAIPNLHVFRPADGIEVGMCYLAALQRETGPSALLFTRQGVPPLARAASVTPDHVLRGGYIVHGHEHQDMVLIATGSEVWVASEAAKLLEADGIKARVVSLPCVELFQQQDAEYRESVIPESAMKVSVEAGITMTWPSVLRSNYLTIGIDHFGASAPGEVLAEKFGFTPQSVAARVKEWVRNS